MATRGRSAVVGSPCRTGSLAMLLVLLLAALGLNAAGPSPSSQQPQASASAAPAPASAAATALADDDIERFLKEAKVTKTKGTPKGVTNSMRATMSGGTLVHDAHIQTVDEYKREFRSALGVEFDFRDSYLFNVAAYKLDRMLGLNLVPVSIRSSYRSTPAAFTWWVDDVMMDEGDRLKKKANPPPDKAQYWNHQISTMRLFDQLIYNTDRNVGNILITADWRLWAIDHTRAFRKLTSLKNPNHVARCDRTVYERLKALTLDGLKRELRDYLDEGQIKGILARRDLIVKKLDSLGPAALFDRQASGTTP
jgi:hypothetical protein